jgi:hypothetical protein
MKKAICASFLPGEGLGEEKERDGEKASMERELKEGPDPRCAKLKIIVKDILMYTNIVNK